VVRTEPWIAHNVEVIDEKRTTLLHCLHGDRGVAGASADATKRFSMIGVGFCSDQIPVGGAAPEIGATGVKEGASQGTERRNELAGLGAVESGPGKFEEKLVERLLILRRLAAV
jgi:hypothetical protein